MNIIYGYCRISTKKQNIERQERNILHRHEDRFSENPAKLLAFFRKM